MKLFDLNLTIGSERKVRRSPQFAEPANFNKWILVIERVKIKRGNTTFSCVASD